MTGLASVAEILGHQARQNALADPPRAARALDRIGVRRGELDRVVRRAVLVRDRWTCQVCGANRRNRRPDLLLEVDHIVPWSAGGADHPVNLRALCRDCNQDRSNRYDPRVDVRAEPVVFGCHRCDTDLDIGDPAVIDAYCLTCRASGSAWYLLDLVVGGAIPTAGVPGLPEAQVPEPQLRPRNGRLVVALDVRARAQTVACPHCSALAGAPCTSGGHPLTRAPAHASRIEMAAAALTAVPAQHAGSAAPDGEPVRPRQAVGA